MRSTVTRFDRYVSHVEQDQRTHDLLILIHSHRGQGASWGDLVQVLSDVIEGTPPVWSRELAVAFTAYAGPYRLWETVLQAIAVAWGQERERNREVERTQ